MIIQTQEIKNYPTNTGSVKFTGKGETQSSLADKCNKCPLFGLCSIKFQKDGTFTGEISSAPDKRTTVSDFIRMAKCVT